jgi:hypothetical protein
MHKHSARTIHITLNGRGEAVTEEVVCLPFAGARGELSEAELKGDDLWFSLGMLIGVLLRYD